MNLLGIVLHDLLDSTNAEVSYRSALEIAIELADNVSLDEEVNGIVRGVLIIDEEGGFFATPGWLINGAYVDVSGSLVNREGTIASEGQIFVGGVLVNQRLLTRTWRLLRSASVPSWPTSGRTRVSW